MSEQSHAPVCTVCIANFNGAAVIQDCLDSVFSQDCSFSLEVVVHDDASTDDSLSIIRESHPEITVISSQTNVGFCASNNRMVAAARGQFILLLNNDASLFPDALNTLYRHASSHELAILGLPQFDADTGKFIDNGYYCDFFANPIPNLARALTHVAFVSGACLWIPKVLWHAAGGFPEWFGSVAEDMYLCARLRLSGYPIIALGESGFRHHVGFSLGGGKVVGGRRLVSTIKRRALSERNKSFAMISTYPLCILLPILPIHLALLMVEGLFISMAKRDFRILIEVYSPIIPSILKAWPKLFMLRKETQRQRRICLREWVSTFRLTYHKLRLILRHGLPELK